MTLLKSRGLIL